jgi:hypothetical protein
VTIGAVLDEAWTLFTRFFSRFFVIGLVVFALVNLVYALVVEAISSDAELAAVVLGIVGLATAVVGTTWLQGAFSRVSSSIAPLFVAGLLAGLGIAVGLMLLVVPGLFLLTIWAVIAPVIVIERRGALESFGRSRELVRGHGWTVFAIVIITGLLSGIASGLLQAAFSFLPRFLEILVGGTIAQAVVAPFVAIALAITYFRLRDAKEGAVAMQAET